MWYEIIPSYLVIVASVGFPVLFAAVTNKLVLGNFYRRQLETSFQQINYLRDRRITGDPYIVRIFEDIGDDVGGGTRTAGMEDVERDKCPADFDTLDPKSKVPEEGVCRVE